MGFALRSHSCNHSGVWVIAVVRQDDVQDVGYGVAADGVRGGLDGVLVGGVEGDRFRRDLEHADVGEAVADAEGVGGIGAEAVDELLHVDPFVPQVHDHIPVALEGAVRVPEDGVRHPSVESVLVREHLGGDVYPAADDDALHAVLLQGGDGLLDPVDHRHALEAPNHVAFAEVGLGGLPFGYVPAHELGLVDLSVDEGAVGLLVAHPEALVDPGPGRAEAGEGAVHVEADEVELFIH